MSWDSTSFRIRRLVSAFIDQAIVFLCFLCLLVVYYSFYQDPGPCGSEDRMNSCVQEAHYELHQHYSWIFFLLPPVLVLYEWIAAGKTLGRHLLKIKVVPKKSSLVFVRAIAKSMTVYGHVMVLLVLTDLISHDSVSDFIPPISRSLFAVADDVVNFLFYVWVLSIPVNLLLFLFSGSPGLLHDLVSKTRVVNTM